MKKKSIILVVILFLCTAAYSSRSYDVGSGLLEGTILDNSTGLRWTKCSMMASGVMDDDSNCNGTPVEYNFEEAVSACDNLAYKGITAWRLPNIRELHSIVTYYYNNYPLINTVFFPKIPEGMESGFSHSHFWSSTTYANETRRAWTFDFQWGSSPPRFKTAGGFVRCVTGP